MNDMFAALAAEFPREAVHWRAQTVTKAGDKALALAYLDARDVMDRLDEVCTPAGWRNTVVETAKGRLIATIEIKIDGDWVGKSDGAGDTAVEGDKGGISDALKRTAVLWGVGRYLYRMDAVWVPCESRDFNGKKQWTRWTADPWNSVRQKPRLVSSQPSGDPKINDTQRDWLIQHAEASVGVDRLLAQYSKKSMKDFTVSELTGARDWLRDEKMKEAA